MPLNLNLNLQGIDTTFPSLAPGEYKASVVYVTGDESKNTTGQYGLSVQFQLELPAKGSKGEDIMPGYKVNYNITLPSDSEPKFKDKRERSTAQFIDAALGSTKENRPALNDELLPSFVGKVMKIVVKARKDGDDQYGDTQIQSVKPLIEGKAPTA